MTDTPIISGVTGATGWIALNRPKARNALTAEMWRQIPHLVAELDANPDVRVIVIKDHNDTHFCAGADISEFADARAGDAASEYEQLNVDALNAISDAKRPTIAQINGFCMGGGFAVAMACDLRLASENAVFSLPPAKLGLAYPLEGLRRLAEIAPPAVIKEMVFTAGRYDAVFAAANGLVNHVLPDADLSDTVSDMCTTIANNAPLTIAAIKASLDAFSASTAPSEAKLRHLRDLCDACFASDDYKEGQAAFLEKRKPVFSGK